MLVGRLTHDPWVRACAVVGALLLGVHAITGLPWPIWFAWAYVVVLSVVEVATATGRHGEPTRLSGG